MSRIPAGRRFQRVAEAFDEVARVRLCESSGSEHSSESFTDLSDLVNSFLESDINHKKDYDHHEDQFFDDDQRKDDDLDGSDSETCKQVLQNLFFEDDHDNGSVKQKIYSEVEAAFPNIIGENSSGGIFKRRLMTHLRDKGFDAGLCKSKWAKSKRYPGGDYEYIDVNVKGNRYLVEPFLGGQFEIARATNQYNKLLEIFPQIFIGKAEKLKKIVRTMCKAIKQSMKSNEMGIPPWRRNEYMQAKWFGSYKRTTNPVPGNINGFESNIQNNFSGNRSVVLGFEAFPKMPYNICRDHFANNNINYGLRVGHLTATLNTSGTIGMQL